LICNPFRARNLPGLPFYKRLDIVPARDDGRHLRVAVPDTMLSLALMIFLKEPWVE
jgi:hypothetical protein